MKEFLPQIRQAYSHTTNRYEKKSCCRFVAIIYKLNKCAQFYVSLRHRFLSLLCFDLLLLGACRCCLGRHSGGTLHIFVSRYQTKSSAGRGLGSHWVICPRRSLLICSSPTLAMAAPFRWPLLWFCLFLCFLPLPELQNFSLSL